MSPSFVNICIFCHPIELQILSWVLHKFLFFVYHLYFICISFVFCLYFICIGLSYLLSYPGIIQWDRRVGRGGEVEHLVGALRDILSGQKDFFFILTFFYFDQVKKNATFLYFLAEHYRQTSIDTPSYLLDVQCSHPLLLENCTVQFSCSRGCEH